HPLIMPLTLAASRLPLAPGSGQARYPAGFCPGTSLSRCARRSMCQTEPGRTGGTGARRVHDAAAGDGYSLRHDQKGRAVGVGAAPARRATRPRRAAAPRGEAYPILSLVWRRTLIGFITLFVVSIVVFAAPQVLPGNAAYAILGRTATPARLQALQAQLHLDRGLFEQYWIWLSGIFTGKLGTSLANGIPVWSYVAPRLANS